MVFDRSLRLGSSRRGRRQPRGRWWRPFGTALALLWLLGGCHRAPPPRFSPNEPLWDDPDRQPFSPPPKEQELFVTWEGFDTHVFAPISRALRVEPAREAPNVNSWDEVPNSSWFENRIGLGDFSPREMARGACDEAPLDPRRLTVTSSKPAGANPGFFVKDERGREFVIKFGGTLQGPRAIAASTVGSRIFYAAGYHTPCNRVVYLRRNQLKIGPEATVEDGPGNERPLEQEDVDSAFDIGLRLKDGRHQAVASRMVEGKPLGPWRYYGTRNDDFNDVIPHQDRRELRAMRLVSALIGHYDSRDGNTLSSWIETSPPQGYVRHYVLDFGESFGSLWTPPAFARQLNHAAYVDLPKMAADWWSLGAIHRPYRLNRFGPSGRVFAYYDVEHFDPAGWETGYPNPAFGRMTESDGAWMARIISHFSDDHLRAAIETADMRDPFLERELLRLLAGRRDEILDRYLTTVSPLAHPSIRGSGKKAILCLTDLLAMSERVEPSSRNYRFAVESAGKEIARGMAESGRDLLCLPLEEAFTWLKEGRNYVVVEVRARTAGQAPESPVRLHLRYFGQEKRAGPWRVVAIQRPLDDEAVDG